MKIGEYFKLSIDLKLYIVLLWEISVSKWSHIYYQASFFLFLLCILYSLMWLPIVEVIVFVCILTKLICVIVFIQINFNNDEVCDRENENQEYETVVE